MREIGERLSVINSLDACGHACSASWASARCRRPSSASGRRRRSGRATGIAGVARARHDEIVAEVRSTLGDDAFEAAVARGAAMSDDEALAFLLGELERVRDLRGPP